VTESIAFDRAAGYYDRTRSLPDDVMPDLVDRYVAVLGGRGRVLEMGIGTGRIARPLIAAGLDLIGFDLAPAMLARLVENAGGVAPLPLVHADATQMPFAAQSFGGAYATHVLHLVPDWEQVLREVARVLVPGGVFVYETNNAHLQDGDGLNRAFEAAAGMARRHPGLQGASAVDELDAAMAGLGARVSTGEAVTVRSGWKPAAVLANIEHGRYSWTWGLDDARRRRGLAAARHWAVQRYGNLDTEIDASFEITLRVYTLG